MQTATLPFLVVTIRSPVKKSKLFILCYRYVTLKVTFKSHLSMKILSKILSWIFKIGEERKQERKEIKKGQSKQGKSNSPWICIWRMNICLFLREGKWGGWEKEKNMNHMTTNDLSWKFKLYSTVLISF